MSGGADAWIRLAHVGMHPDRLHKLVTERGSPERVLRDIESGRREMPPAARKAAAVPAADRRDELARAGIAFLLRDDAEFPERLRELPDAPFFLFQTGRSFTGVAVAIVGTRRCTGYGRRLAESYGEAVSRAGWSVVSGLARGIDGAAHQGSLLGGAPGVAVLGSGVDVWYPRRHAELGALLLEGGGTVWSEAPPGARPLGWRFPPRNRIISGISHAVVVVEAGLKGGALITARSALDQGRDVFATPGDVGRASSAGTNHLIRDGAFPVHDAEDLVESLGLAIGEPPQTLPADPISPPVASAGVPMADFLATLGSDPAAAIVELGRLVAFGKVVIDPGGVVLSVGDPHA